MYSLVEVDLALVVYVRRFRRHLRGVVISGVMDRSLLSESPKDVVTVGDSDCSCLFRLPKLVSNAMWVSQGCDGEVGCRLKL